MSRKCRCKRAPIIFQQTLNINCGSGLALPPSLGSCPTSFGTGADADLTIPSGMSLVMTRDYNFNTLTIQAGGMIVTNGFNLFVNRLLTLNGTIQNNGGNGSTTGPGLGGGGGSAGGQPSANVFAANTSSGGNGTSGNGGIATPSLTPLDESLTALSVGRIQNTAGVKYTGGAGGGNPNGGGGGGVIGIFTRQIVSSNSAIIQANGGNGFGGGGGGGGGLVFIFAGENLSQPSILPTLQALGGHGNAEGQVGNIVTIFCTAP